MDLLSARVIAGVVALVAVFTCTVAQQNDMCDFNQQSPANNVSVRINPTSRWSTAGACRCSVRTTPTNNAMMTQSTQLKIVQTFHLSEAVPDDTDCLPFIAVQFMQVSPSRTVPRPLNFDLCPLSSSEATAGSVVELGRDQELVVHIENAQELKLTSSVSFHGDSLTVECSGADPAEVELCPCRGPAWGGVPVVSSSTWRRQLAIGLSVAIIFLLVIVIIVVALHFYRKRKAQREPSNKEAVTAENKAYQGSKQSVNEPKHGGPAPGQTKVNYTPDPNLNLSLQSGGKPGYTDSRDSGLASAHSDKRLPFMQPQGSSVSLDNLTAMPENYPPLAGHGSKASLDRQSDRIEPVYSTRTGAAPTPLTAGSPNDNWPPLAGHGSQSSLDRLDSRYPGEDVYAQVNKPQRSASADRLNAVHRGSRDRLNSATMAEPESLNASRVTIETDV